MRMRLVRNLRRGDRVILWSVRGVGGDALDVLSVDTADIAGLYGVKLEWVDDSGSPPPIEAVWHGDDLVELV